MCGLRIINAELFNMNVSQQLINDVKTHSQGILKLLPHLALQANYYSDSYESSRRVKKHFNSTTEFVQRSENSHWDMYIYVFFSAMNLWRKE